MDAARVQGVAVGAEGEGADRLAVALTGSVPDGYGFMSAGGDSVPQKLPGTRTFHVSAVDGVGWGPDFYQYSGKKDADGNPVVEVTSWGNGYLKLKAGRTYQQRFNTAVFGPLVSSDNGFTRDGRKIGSLDAPLAGDRQFKVLPSCRPSGRTVAYPVTVQGAAKDGNLRSLAVWVSYDHGRTWKKVTVHNGRITVKNPAMGNSVFLRGKVTDKKNNTSTITIHDAYYGQ
ncbi:hypothetical protein [Streptomyces sp. AS02]|uniref:hypothetical protein n=1 Tax=Streptomyces sp. AS02 TaxID=2938946 RepID=UPI0020200604|nr:hypothetical protein [Streptomyces sp. AS02]MCL8010935.1 hypothetical protein [Streptomyces sp. AS02]